MMEALLNKSFKVNLLVAILVSIFLYILFFISLGFITRHGSEVTIPNVMKKDLKTAESTLETMGFEVLVDSAYDPKQKPLTVLSQVPEVGATVKTGRTVFITVNRKQPPMTPMPNLVGLSYRSAAMILKNNKLNVGDTIYKPDIAKGAILEQLYKGKPVRPGDPVPQGSKISLVIGDGLSNTEIDIPDVIGINFLEAETILSGTGLQYYPVWEGDITDSSAAIVYKQNPRPLNELGQPNRIKEGDMVEIYILQNPSNEQLEESRKPLAPPVPDAPSAPPPSK